MIISAIEKKRKMMSAVYIDGEYFMHLDTQTLILKGVKIGDEISQSDLDLLVKESQERRAREKALYLIEYRDHSKKELIDKIKRTSSEEAAHKAADKMEELGLVNDEEFAKRYARELLYRKHFSKDRATYQLQLKGIDKDKIEEILNEIEIDPVDQICSIIKNKYLRKLSDEKNKRRTIAALQRLGYKWQDIKSALTLCNVEEENEYTYE